MVRKQVYIAPAHERFLKQRARELGMTEAELIRRGIEQLAASPRGTVFDPEAWAEEERFMDERAKLRPDSPPWRFDREEIYAERLGRLPR